MKTLIKKIFIFFGLEIKRYRRNNPLDWLKNYNIQTILDIGANTGQFAHEIRQILPKAQIYSFEPVLKCYEDLSNNMREDRNFKAFNAALGETESRAEINVSSYSLSSSLLKMTSLHKEMFPHTKGGGKEQIKIMPLDSFLNKLNLRNDMLIKIDVQGYEDKVINGGLKTLSRAKIVLVETSFKELYEGQPLFGQICEILKNLNFFYVGGIHQVRDPRTEELIFEDSVFARKDDAAGVKRILPESSDYFVIS